MREKFLLRPMRPEEFASLREWTYLSLFVPEGCPPFPRTILKKPQVRHYYEGFGGKAGDEAVVAEAEGKLIGAAWARILAGEPKGYGNLDGETPELAIAVEALYRGQGVGTGLLEALFQKLRRAGYERVSLSAQKENRALGLYHRLGFRVEVEKAEEVLMARKL
ncbi:GNAT family N-acetyltransferase [Ruminococcaceae bacterium OttesenSCG-928-I18]|nr:GNAT family N-acetyltransferase [Ruminococcaceae bacterium OttesenSCG-928-I18]